MTCIKTGTDVYFENYGAAYRTDVYQIGDTYVFRFNTTGYYDTSAEIVKANGGWVVEVFIDSNSVFHREDIGVSVVPSYLVHAGDRA